ILIAPSWSIRLTITRVAWECWRTLASTDCAVRSSATSTSADSVGSVSSTSRRPAIELSSSRRVRRRRSAAVRAPSSRTVGACGIRTVFLEASEQPTDRCGQCPGLECGGGGRGDDATRVPGALCGEILDLGERLPGMAIGGALRRGVGDEPDRRDRLSDRVMDIAGDAGAFLDLAGMPLGQSELVLQIEQILVGKFEGAQQLLTT